MAFQCTHTMGRPEPSLHRESTDSLIFTCMLPTRTSCRFSSGLSRIYILTSSLQCHTREAFPSGVLKVALSFFSRSAEEEKEEQEEEEEEEEEKRGRQRKKGRHRAYTTAATWQVGQVSHQPTVSARLKHFTT